MKLRETLLDNSGDSGKTEVTCPDGISIYPHNSIFFWFFSIAFVLGCCGVIGMTDFD